MPARLSVAAGGAVTLVSSCDGERGEPEQHRWCEGRAPPVSRPSCRLRSQTGSKRSKVGAETLRMIETMSGCTHIHILRDVESMVVKIQYHPLMVKKCLSVANPNS